MPPKEKPYTQHDMDVVIGHPVTFDLSVRGETRGATPPMRGTIVNAVINDDGSATITLDVATRTVSTPE